MSFKSLIRKVQYGIIWFLDWVVDDFVLDHRISSYCMWLGEHSWWDTERK